MTSAWYFKEPLRNETKRFLIPKLCFPWLVYTVTPSNSTHYYLTSSVLSFITKTTKKFPAEEKTTENLRVMTGPQQTSYAASHNIDYCFLFYPNEVEAQLENLLGATAWGPTAAQSNLPGVPQANTHDQLHMLAERKIQGKRILSKQSVLQRELRSMADIDTACKIVVQNMNAKKEFVNSSKIELALLQSYGKRHLEILELAMYELLIKLRHWRILTWEKGK